MIKNPCPICQSTPDAHSFQTIPSVNPSIHLLYSCPAKASQYYHSSGVLQHFALTVNKINKPWVYILDCSGFTFQHASQIHTSIEIAKRVLEKEHLLKKVYIIHFAWPIKLILDAIQFILPNTVLEKITYSENKIDYLQNNYFIDIL